MLFQIKTGIPPALCKNRSTAFLEKRGCLKQKKRRKRVIQFSPEEN
jgi:hypothetical protein